MIIPLVFFIIVYARLIDCVNYSGSKLGTNQYNRELSAVSFGADDRQAILRNYKMWKPHPLLCATFASSKVITSFLKDNIKLMGKKCDWAVIYYDDDEVEIAKRCAELDNVVHCDMFPLDSRTSITVPGSNTSIAMSIPKTVLYTALLPYLSFYKRVFLMDEDMLLTGFNVTTFSSVWDCAFGRNPPLVVQPVIAGSGQDIPFVNEDTWKNYTDVVAAEVGLVEQQVTLFDSIFFDWFVRRVLSQTYWMVLKYGVDWGGDRSWCNAARMYSTMVLGDLRNESVVCAVLVKGGSVQHMNGRTMAVKKLYRGHHLSNAIKVVQQYVNLFPTWVATDILGACNPLNKGSTLRRFYSVNQTCVLKGLQ